MDAWHVTTHKVSGKRSDFLKKIISRDSESLTGQDILWRVRQMEQSTEDGAGLCFPENCTLAPHVVMGHVDISSGGVRALLLLRSVLWSGSEETQTTKLYHLTPVSGTGVCNTARGIFHWLDVENVSLRWNLLRCLKEEHTIRKVCVLFINKQNTNFPDWSEKVKAIEKTYIWVSVWWETKN